MTALCKLESIVGRSIYRLLRSPLLIILLLMLHLLLLLLLLLLLPLLLLFPSFFTRIDQASKKDHDASHKDRISIPCWERTSAVRTLVTSSDPDPALHSSWR